MYLELILSMTKNCAVDRALELDLKVNEFIHLYSLFMLIELIALNNSKLFHDFKKAIIIDVWIIHLLQVLQKLQINRINVFSSNTTKYIQSA